ncbi:YkgJ family cysteine cluster protein [Paenibacillus sp. SI8]|uniref:YkgJ family cysteine cluster protein n=1 Tax=unclassified Paenibacillus TaxID=185978 RepID=UPI003465B899
MSDLPCQGCKGLCCGPVPVTQQELQIIKKKVKSMPAKVRKELEHQERHFGTCIFYDLDHDKCGIHAVRPAVCRAFGYYRNLVCFRKPEAAAAHNWNMKEQPSGILSVDYTWKDF